MPSNEALEVVKKLIERAAELKIDWEPELAALGPGPYTARQVVNAISDAAMRVANNMVKNNAKQ